MCQLFLDYFFILLYLFFVLDIQDTILMFPKRSIDQTVILKNPFDGRKLTEFTISWWSQLNPLSWSTTNNFLNYWNFDAGKETIVIYHELYNGVFQLTIEIETKYIE